MKKGRFSEIVETTTIPKMLYHYTSSVGLLGIFKSKKIWTTKIHYLNDSSELSLGLDYIRKEIQSQKGGNNRFRSDEELDDMLNVIFSIESVNVGVASFTENGDQLSQWRGYTKLGSGYSLGFDGDGVNNQALSDLYYFVPCIYNQEDHRLLAKELVDFGRVAGKIQEEKGEISILHKMDFSRAVLLVATMIKAGKFEEEKEWRLVTPLMDYREANFRPGDFSLLPYWEYDLRLEKTLKQIIIGPTQEPDLSYKSTQGVTMHYFSRRYNDGKIKVENSAIPFRRI